PDRAAPGLAATVISVDGARSRARLVAARRVPQAGRGAPSRRPARAQRRAGDPGAVARRAPRRWSARGAVAAPRTGIGGRGGLVLLGASWAPTPRGRLGPAGPGARPP